MVAPSIAHPLDFSGKSVLVVGGSSGIGNGIAQAFRRQGASVEVWGTRATRDDYDAAGWRTGGSTSGSPTRWTRSSRRRRSMCWC
jgi:NAD(P)-dependent dehydrogenase (short-subunit alcohol dehydrogenase family)